MQIKLTQKYFSLEPFTSDYLPSFSVIIGKNGSGKSQLLRLIRETIQINLSQISGPYYGGNNCSLGTYFTKCQYQGIGIFSNTDSDTPMSGASIEEVKQYLPIILNGLINNELFKIIVEENIDPNTIRTKKLPISDNPRYLAIINKLCDERHESEESLITNLMYSFYVNPYISQVIKLVKNAKKFTKKNYNELTPVDIMENTPQNEILFVDNNLFNVNLEKVVYGYCLRRHKNSYQYFRKERYKETNSSVSEDEFNSKFLPPWKFLNDIFDTLNLPFYIPEVKMDAFSESVKIGHFKILHKHQDLEIMPNDFSDGEKIIIGIAAKVFLSTNYKESLAFPEVIILDEPDGPLHPHMITQLITMLKEVFAESLGIKVIISTHSPTTVALSPADSIFELKNFEDTSLKRIDKDEALKILTAGIPTLAIDYKNHKQVFVEAPNDRYYYQCLYDKISTIETLEYKLYFICSEAGKGNCDSVKNVVEALQLAGVKTGYGIIDRDKNNTSTEFIKIHGDKERYSIENYLFDPFPAMVLLIKDNILNVRDELNLSETFNEFDLKNVDDIILQNFVDYYFDKLTTKSIKLNLENNKKPTKVSIEYFDGRSFLIPEWFLNMQGHEDLIPQIKLALPPLFDKYSNNNQIERELTIATCKIFPLVPKSSVDTIKLLANQ